jgi:hypothetical protein
MQKVVVVGLVLIVVAMVVVVMLVTIVTVAASLNYLQLQAISILTVRGLRLINTSPDR